MIQAISLAIAGSFYPVGLVFVLRYLAAVRGLVIATAYLIGGAIGCVLVSVVELILLNALPLDRHKNSTPNGTIDIVLGFGLIVIAGVAALRRKHPEVETLAELPPSQKDPSPARALLVGLVIYSPGLGLIAAIKALFDAKLPGGELVLGVAICVVIILWMAEVPILATLISPVRSKPVLLRAGEFVARHGRTIALVIAAGLGIYLIIKGISIASSN